MARWTGLVYREQWHAKRVAIQFAENSLPPITAASRDA
jgi:hypothetical protein